VVIDDYFRRGATTMRRILAISAAAITVLSLTLPAPSADGDKKLVVTWYGQSFFQLQTPKGTKLVFDPHLKEEFSITRNMVDADIVLMSHFHEDHTQIGALKERPNKDEKIKIITGLVNRGGKRDEWNVVDEKFKDLKIRSVGVYHDRSEGMQRGKVGAFVVEVEGLKIAFLGDLGHELTDDQIKQFGVVDVLFIPVGGVFTLNGDDAKKVVEQLKPRRYIIPMHFGVPKVCEELCTEEEFMDEVPSAKVMRFVKHRFEIPLDKKRENEPIYAVPTWEIKPKK
jgi:L-ascorbate metabolism protein UlaG (beta-lactamase superfamily)